MIINKNSFVVVLIGKFEKCEKRFGLYLCKNDEIA